MTPTKTRAFGSGARVGHDSSKYYELGLRPLWHREIVYEDGPPPQGARNPNWIEEVRELRAQQRAIEDRLAHIYWTTPLEDVSVALERDGWTCEVPHGAHGVAITYEKEDRRVLAPTKRDAQNYYARRTCNVANALLDDDSYGHPESVLQPHCPKSQEELI